MQDIPSLHMYQRVIYKLFHIRLVKKLTPSFSMSGTDSVKFHLEFPFKKTTNAGSKDFLTGYPR